MKNLIKNLFKKLKNLFKKYPFGFLETLCLLGAGFSLALAQTCFTLGNTMAATAWTNCFIWASTAFICSTNK